MSKITFRADEDLIDRVERLDASKSEVMREALRAYLVEDEPARSDRGRGDRALASDRGSAPAGESEGESTLDEFVAERVDALLDERLDAVGQDVNLTISLEGAQGASVDSANTAAPTNTGESDGERIEAAPDEPVTTCGQCGSDIDPDHVHCPNCGEKATRRVFCDCGDELRSDWSFCPGCGRRTPAADVLDSG